ncbi:NAD-binding protein [Desulfosporosinus sp. BICA1-9]|uniref:NAD-binding protein n=1 Tax=Desulfosporosinus sp. BICA1-9 TaxID=1531958 RepID=UPI00054C7D99|nr:NAD-binding protein [Desulfosporosinus sp. BICA1-9]KJS48172.1 MAG: nucleotide sugar dehydrogenase [Peptococcaceae bacterium BRH_c23]KJS89864.1 MAG: nucleotide sugar dehydrogenase [Desulfosporosinus sp. BICA1-9]HBW34987.1 nucleotide sugar dehydrogenase [Desulfosporosinus sp.]
MKICVVGLGNIGFNLFTYLSHKFPGEVIGVDVNESRVSELRSKGYRVTSDYRALTGIKVWLMAPSTGNQGQNLFAALKQMIIFPGSLISIESTLPPGTMRRVREFLEGKGFELGTDIFVIHVPHRVMFGVDKTVCDTPRVMGAFTKACLEKGRQFYVPLVPLLVEVSDVRIAELSKVVENVKRYIDIAFAQEIYGYCVTQGMDYDDLRMAVNSKSNVELLGTDWGIGGECLPKDMSFLRTVCPSTLLEGAEQADQDYRDRIVNQVGSGKEVLVRGLSYKTGVKDLKHSRGVDLVRALEATGNTVWVEDPLFSSAELSGAGFNSINEVDQDQVVDRLVLDRQKALDIK